MPETSPLLLQTLERMDQRLERIEVRLQSVSLRRDHEELEKRVQKTETSLVRAHTIAGLLWAALMGLSAKAFGWLVGEN